MNDKYFDQHLKSALDNLEPDYDPASWTLLSQRLDAVFSEEQPAPVEAVDKAVYHKLERLETPYQPSHWAMLAARLDVQAYRLRRLRLAKTAELVLLLLFVWNTGSFWGNQTDVPVKPLSPRPDVPVAQATPRTPKHPGETRSYGQSSNGLPAGLDNVLGASDAPVLLSGEYTRASDVPSLLQSLNQLAQQARRVSIAAADLLPCDALNYVSAHRPLPDMAPVAVAIDPQRNQPVYGPFYVTAAGGLQQNRVLINNNRRTHTGYSASLAAGFRTKNWGVEVGAGYASRQYTPKREVEIYGGNVTNGYFGSSLTEVNADMLTLPVKVTRRVARMGKTTAHAVAGVTTHIALDKSYDYGTVYYSPDALPPNFLPDPNQSPKLRQVGRGVLEEGGRLKGNVYASLDAGIRVERPINRRYTAFIEPGFHASLTGKGIGPKREPINTLSIQAGIMAYL